MEVFELGDFDLTSGVTLPQAKLAYKTHGELSDSKDNVILFPNFLGGAPEVLEMWIGEGRPLDPSRYFIVLPGHFGLPPTSSPSNTPAPHDAGNFPAVHIADDVIAQHRLLTKQLGISELQLVLGWSVGALQTYEWAVRYPEIVKRMASIAGAPRPSPWTRLWLRNILEEPLVADPAYNGGTYESAEAMHPAIRRMARLTAVTLPPPTFYGEGEERFRTIGFSSVEEFITGFWEGFWLPQDPNNIITQARKAHDADPSQGGEMKEALGRITANAIVVAFTGDPMFQPDECRHDAERIANAEFRGVQSQSGHLATFALADEDREAIDGALRDILSR